MATLLEVLHVIHSYVEHAVTWIHFLSFVVVAVVFWFFVSAVFRPVRELLGFVVFYDERPWRQFWLILKEIGFCLREVPETRSLLKAVRLRVESEVFDPSPARPSKLDFPTQEEYRAGQALYKRKKAAWRGLQRERLARLAYEVQAEDQNPTIKVDNCFALQKPETTARIQRYFKVLERTRSPRVQDRDRFISKVEVATGFLAPLHLLTGLVNHYDDNWPPVIQSYGRLVTRPDDPFDEFSDPTRVMRREPRHGQAFLFYCWLLWGPSIPLCTCSQWIGGKTLQFGYGDESNSLPLLVSDESLEHLAGMFIGRPKGETAATATGDERTAAWPLFARRLAVQVSIVGVPRWGPGLKREDLCSAQQGVRDRDTYGLVLEYERHTEAGGLAVDREARYYSAYIWVMFVIEDESGQPLSPAERWRNLLPFFEHANVGEDATYTFLKETLVRKALGSVARLIQATERRGGRQVKFRYACAVDDSGCGQELYAPAVVKIREEMGRLLATEEFSGLKASGRFLLDPPFGGRYAACQFPEILSEFYDSLGSEKQEEFTWTELSDSNQDDDRLVRFYQEVYEPAFPDANERESLEKLRGYLGVGRSGAHGKNRHHILLALKEARSPEAAFGEGLRGRWWRTAHTDEKVVAGAVIDYLAGVNAGVLEFLVVHPEFRSLGLGTTLRKWAEEVVANDARQQVGRFPEGIFAEVDDPFKSPERDGLDPFTRAEIWGAWGYRRLDFPYVQPALATGKRPVSKLMLTVRTVDPNYARRLPAEFVKNVVREYIRWAMNDHEPEANVEYKAMRRYLDGQPDVAAEPLAEYLGRSPGSAPRIEKISSPRDAQLESVLRLYQQAFPAGATRLAPNELPGWLSRRSSEYRYHLWAIKRHGAAEVGGMVSFLTLQGSGFGGYVTFDTSLKGDGRLRPLLALIEEQMIRDDLGARGWYIESPPANVELFSRVGFRALALSYRQPPLPGHPKYGLDTAPKLELMYKPFGCVYAIPSLDVKALTDALESIFRVVYDITTPDHAVFLEDLRRQIESWGDGNARFR
jgi:GNAT superfamily N-acetyltransferase